MDLKSSSAHLCRYANIMPVIWRWRAKKFCATCTISHTSTSRIQRVYRIAQFSSEHCAEHHSTSHDTPAGSQLHLANLQSCASGRAHGCRRPAAMSGGLKKAAPTICAEIGARKSRVGKIVSSAQSRGHGASAILPTRLRSRGAVPTLGVLQWIRRREGRKRHGIGDQIEAAGGLEGRSWSRQ